MTRLLLRHLPQHYGSASALALFPFQVIYIIFSGLIVWLSTYLHCVGTREDAQVHEERARHRQVFGIQLEPFEHSNLSACHRYVLWREACAIPAADFRARWSRICCSVPPEFRGFGKHMHLTHGLHVLMLVQSKKADSSPVRSALRCGLNYRTYCSAGQDSPLP
jgi:hypothetical protein